MQSRGAGEPRPVFLPAVPGEELPCSRSGVAGSEARRRRAPETHAASVCFSAQMAGAAEASRNLRFCLLSPALAPQPSLTMPATGLRHMRALATSEPRGGCAVVARWPRKLLAGE
ncbi:hypothetical protein PAL_GLEAN10016484 [Pteropus alecto]|uniref:Uncharacterized protein n=1 Tax=Pteropus alecto TaxID=9402 RepID=L5KUA9_PTEAL|nr:hypothetical protein PAL_GLEAN10016484 [Pteropus alecto]